METPEDKEWQTIANTLTNYFDICGCQRKIKLIVDNLFSIYEKGIAAQDGPEPRDFTGAEWLLIAIMDSKSNAISHGINCEYPIIMRDDPFWKWLISVKDKPCLKDN